MADKVTFYYKYQNLPQNAGRIVVLIAQDTATARTVQIGDYSKIITERSQVIDITRYYPYEYDDVFSTIKQRLDALTVQEKKNYVNNTLPFITENIAIKPSSWDALSEHEKEEFSMIFYGLPELMEIEGEKFDRFQRTSFDLFAL